MRWGILLAAGRGNLAMHKQLDRLWEENSLVNQELVPRIELDPDDRNRPAPPRDRWWYAIRKVRVIPRVAELKPQTLLMVGRHDPQTPPRVSQALHERIPDSQLVIFERSGHSPFLEEPDRFSSVLAGSLMET